MNRRGFIGTAAGLGGLFLATALTSALALEDRPRNAMLIVEGRCIGCMLCVKACAEYHKEFYNVVTDGTAYTKVPLAAGKKPIPQNCMHCVDAPCVGICQGRALRQLDSGAVVYEEEKCIGCFLCTTVCPFESITTDVQNKKIFKCDLCSKITEKGEPPSCVKACPTQAKTWGPYEEKVKEAQELARQTEGTVLYAHDAAVIYVLTEYEMKLLSQAPEVTVIKPDYPSEYKSYSNLTKWLRLAWVPFLVGSVLVGLTWRRGKEKEEGVS